MEKKYYEKKGSSEDNLTIGARGGAIAFALKILSTALGFLNQIILARVLGAGGLGEVLLAISVVRIFSQIAKFGMEEAMMRFVSLYLEKGDISRLKGTIKFSLKFCVVISVVLVGIVIISSKFISIHIFHSESIQKLILVIAISIPAVAIREVIGGILKGYKDALRGLLPESFVPVIRIVVFLLLLITGVSPLYAIIAFLAGEFVALLLAIMFLVQRLKPERAISEVKCERKKILDLALSVIFTGISILLFTQVDIWILKMYKPFEDVGIYGVAAKIVILAYFPMLAFASIIPPIISSVHSSGNHEELENIVSESTRWILSMAMPVILILILEGKLILQYIYGNEFALGYTVLIILCISQLVRAGAGLVGVILQMTGKHKILMTVYIFWGFVNIIMNIILVPHYGMEGAAIATAFCLIMADIICVIAIYKKMSVLTFAKEIRFDLLFIALISAIVYFLVRQNIFYQWNHILLIAALTIYISKSVLNHDIPWRLLVPK